MSTRFFISLKRAKAVCPELVEGRMAPRLLPLLGILGVVGMLFVHCPAEAVEGPKRLILHFTGASEAENLSAMMGTVFEDDFQRSPPRVLKTRAGWKVHSSEFDQGLGARVLLLQLNEKVYPHTNNAVVTFAFDFEGHDAHDWIKQNHYPPSVVSYLGNEASTISKLVEEFKKSYPDGEVYGMAACVGCEVLLRTMEKSIVRLKRIILVAPPINDEKGFLELMGRYQPEQVTVIVADKDEFVPNRLHADTYPFTVITATDKGQSKLSWHEFIRSPDGVSL